MFSDNFRRGEGKGNGKTGSKAVSKMADLGWKAFQAVNTVLPEGKSIQPAWAAEPLLKSYERTAPPLGFPRETDSLCPACVKSVRNGVISGDIPLNILMDAHPGEIKAQIVEENGQVLMRKECPTHGMFEDVLATDANFLERIESLFFGRDFKAAEDKHVHHHGTSDIKFGRGAVLTVDLTNRCNMMCNPCFMDANQVGYVHEPTFEDTKAILDRAVSFKPKRQIIILFSGGEPTLSPYFLDAVAYAKKVGFYRILAATNGIRYAEDIEFCKAAKAAGQHGVYLQFDGTNEEDNKHRGVGNLFDVKLKAIENLASVGIKVTLVTTIVNSWNNDGIGSIVKFAAENIDKARDKLRPLPLGWNVDWKKVSCEWPEWIALKIVGLVLTPCDAFDNFVPLPIRHLRLFGRTAWGLWLLAQTLRWRFVQRLPIAFGLLTERPIPAAIMRSYTGPLRDHASTRRDFAALVRKIHPHYTVDVAPRLASYRRPVLLLWARERRRFFPLEHAHRLAAIFPDARVEVIEDSGPFVTEDQPAAVASAIRRFVAERVT